jgi:hypothetical protein
MKWILIKDRKPEVSKKYFWKGKDGDGGYNYYYQEKDRWDFQYVSDTENIMWLEEDLEK